MTVKEFNDLYDRAVTISTEEIESGANGTGYFDNLVYKTIKGLDVAGDTVKGVDQYGRKVILIKLVNTNLVIFQRYANDDSAYVYNSSINGLFKTGNILLDQVPICSGSPLYTNIGHWLSDI